MILVNGFEPTYVKFPNNEITLNLPRAAFDFKEAEIIFKFEDNDDFLKLNLIESYLEENKYFDKTECHILYMPYSRMDRVEQKNPFSLNVVVGMLPKSWSYVLYEPHSDMTETLFKHYNIEHKIFFTSQFLLDLFLKGKEVENLVIVLPDKGAFNRYIEKDILEIDSSIKIMYANKVRNFDTQEITSFNFEGSVIPEAGFEAVILDDLSSYGGTFIKTVEELKKIGCVGTSLITAHAEDSIYRGELLNHLDEYLTTDSMLTFTSSAENLKVISMASVVNSFKNT